MRLCIVDFSAVFRVFWHAKAHSDFWHAKAHSDMNAPFELTLGKIRGIAEKYDRVALALDSKRSRRKEMSAAYKADREPVEAACVEQMRRCLEVLALDGFPQWESDGDEGDDVIASFCAWARTGGHQVTIAGVDKDFCQCLREDPRVELLNSSRGDILDANSCFLKHGVTPSQWIDFQTMCGDSTDSVVGVKGCGPVNAAKLLKEHRNLAGVIKASLVEDKGDGKPLIHPPSIRAAIIAAMPHLDMARQLVTLRTDCDCDFAAILKERARVVALAESWRTRTK